MGPVAQSVYRLATCWTVRGSNPGGGARFSAPVQTGPGAHPASCKMGTGSFLGIKSGRGVMLTPHHLLVPWSRKCRAIPLLPYGLTACTEGQCLYKGALYLYLYHVNICLSLQTGIYTNMSFSFCASYPCVFSRRLYRGGSMCINPLAPELLFF